METEPDINPISTDTDIQLIHKKYFYTCTYWYEGRSGNMLSVSSTAEVKPQDMPFPKTKGFLSLL